MTNPKGKIGAIILLIGIVLIVLSQTGLFKKEAFREDRYGNPLPPDPNRPYYAENTETKNQILLGGIVGLIAGGIFLLMGSSSNTRSPGSQLSAPTAPSSPTNAPPSTPMQVPVTSPNAVFTSPAGAALVALCFFLPWGKFNCGGVQQTATGAELGGVLWLVFVASLLALGSFFYFRSLNQVEKAKPLILWSTLAACAILAVRYLVFMSGERTQFGTIRPRDLGFTLQFGAIGTLIGLGLALWGIQFLKKMEVSAGSKPQIDSQDNMGGGDLDTKIDGNDKIY